MTSVSSAASGAVDLYARQKEMFDKTDADKNGSLSQTEFVSSRPKEMSETQATKAYARLDTEDTGAVTLEQMSAAHQGPEARMGGDAMGAVMGLRQQGGMPPMGGPMDPSSAYDDMDADSDSKVTKDEFLSKAPGGDKDTIAGQIFDAIDTESQGYITEDQFSTFVTENAPQPPQGFNGLPPAYQDITA